MAARRSGSREPQTGRWADFQEETGNDRKTLRNKGQSLGFFFFSLCDVEIRFALSLFSFALIKKMSQKLLFLKVGASKLMLTRRHNRPLIPLFTLELRGC